MDKRELRRVLRELKRVLLPDTDSNRCEEAVFSTIEALKEFSGSHNILMYYSLPDELTTEATLNRWQGAGRQVYLPRVNGELLDIMPYVPDNMAKGAFGIKEPSGGIVADSGCIDMVIVPGVAFDCECNRLGRGRGYYDRLLSGMRADVVTIGVGYDFQLIDHVPVDEHDIKLDYVVTPSCLIVKNGKTRLNM